jgi:ATP-dependent Clp protease ATP-binding subunit ClpX
MFRIITEPKNSIVKQYQHLVKSTNGSNLTFTDSGLQRIVTKTIEKGTGARGIRSVFETFMMPIIYELPDLPPSDYVIDEELEEELEEELDEELEEGAAMVTDTSEELPVSLATYASLSYADTTK